MFDRFTARKPKPRKAAVAPLRGPEQAAPAGKAAGPDTGKPPKELGGPSGPEPTRYGDWERKGICVDF